jgi:ribosomal peptide maturation radical SAM protein 1
MPERSSAAARSPGPDDWEAYRWATLAIGPFLDACLDADNWGRFGVVGFSTTFQQTAASVALARRIKARFPHVVIAFGGANVEGPMGRELLRQAPAIDWVVSGEADHVFPAAVRRWLDHEPHDDGLPGLTTREATGAPLGCTRATVPDLDALSIPDFTAHFTHLAASPLRAEIDPMLVFESSRDCWWGAKHHCTFCGLNGGGMVYRRKTPERVVDELRILSQRHVVWRACAADNILDHDAWRSLLPQLLDAHLGIDLEYEIKPLLGPDQASMLAEAGVRAAQLGIESLSPPALRRLRKGGSVARSVEALKWLAGAGIAAKWNWLLDPPAGSLDSDSDDEALPERIAALSNLPPPQAVGSIRFDRFSPYYEEPGAFGLPRLVPHRAYAHVYPFSPDSLDRLAYAFEAESAPPSGSESPIRAAIAAWHEDHSQGTLRMIDQPDDDAILLIDTRLGAQVPQRRLRGLERRLYLACERTTSRTRLQTLLQAHTPDALPKALDGLLDKWTESQIALVVESECLALAIRHPRDVPAPNHVPTQDGQAVVEPRRA